MTAGPIERSAAVTLDVRAEMFAAGHLEHVSLVEIDAVSAFRRLLANGSPRLRQALIEAALSYSPRN